MSDAETYARALARDIGWDGDLVRVHGDLPAVAWRRSGLMEVTGFPGAPGLAGPPGLVEAADGAAWLFTAMTGLAPRALPPGAALLGERARLLGLFRGGQTAPGGSCRLVSARDGWLAVNLPRDEDWAAVPAWLETEAANWDDVTQAVAQRPRKKRLDRARLLGLAVAAADEMAPDWCKIFHAGSAGAARWRRPVVIDLSTLWAGPLAGSLLAAAGARVIKVEHCGRHDGARLGHAGFFDRLNGGKESVTLDFGEPDGRAALRRLLAGADIVLESARPRALRQLGIEAEDLVAGQPGLVWVSITAYGRDGDAGLRVGFGDDTAIAGGVGRAMADRYGHMMFAGDAVADPLTGLHAACVAWAAWAQGGGVLASLTLAGVVARALRFGGHAAWDFEFDSGSAGLYRLPPAIRKARKPGADNAAVFAMLAA